MAMEFGHSLVSPSQPGPLHDEEERLTAYISQKLYDNKQAVEYEDIVSGRGLEITYQWVVSELEKENKADGVPRDLNASAIANASLVCFQQKENMIHI